MIAFYVPMLRKKIVAHLDLQQFKYLVKEKN